LAFVLLTFLYFYNRNENHFYSGRITMATTTRTFTYIAPYRPNPRPWPAAYPNAFYPGRGRPYRYNAPLPPYYANHQPYLQKQAITFASKPEPTVSSRFIALVKAVGLITPAILLAKYAPSKLRNELLPSDWKVWAKIFLGLTSLNQLNKALNWQPPPWLHAMGNVALITPLISGFEKKAFKSVLWMAPAVAALVQVTHWISDNAEKPLQNNFGIPPLVTRLACSVASMGLGFWALPKVSQLSNLLGTATKEESAAAAASAVQTCPSGCCSGSVLCMNELLNYGGAMGNWVHRSITGKKADA
jgi:hypothetical protein